MRVLKILFLFCIPTLLSAQSFTEKWRPQLGLEMGKYFRNWAYVKSIPVELVLMLRHTKATRIYPSISVGYGNFEMTGNNFKNSILGIYTKPGADFYFGKKTNTLSGIITGKMIFGNYLFKEKITAPNPVWGDEIVQSARHGNLLGIEFGLGIAQQFSDLFELKIYVGGRGVLARSAGAQQTKGIIPGFGKGMDKYQGSPFWGIVFSYRFTSTKK